MKQNFSEILHTQFIEYFNIKKIPTKVENKFYKKTEKYIKYIKWIPGLKMIGIGNSISMNCSSHNSDIDLLIVTSNNSMWLNRIIITFIFQILGVRKTAKKHAGRFCLSFFSTIDGLDFNSWKIENDIYLYFWILYFKPILDFNNTYELFIEKNDSWADFNKYKYMLNENKKFIKYSHFNKCIVKKTKSKPIKFIIIIFKNIYYFLPNTLNKIFKLFFLQKTLKHYKTIGKPYGIIINNNILKFHNGDIRKKIKKDLIINN